MASLSDWKKTAEGKAAHRAEYPRSVQNRKKNLPGRGWIHYYSPYADKFNIGKKSMDRIRFYLTRGRDAASIVCLMGLDPKRVLSIIEQIKSEPK